MAVDMIPDGNDPAPASASKPTAKKAAPKKAAAQRDKKPRRVGRPTTAEALEKALTEKFTSWLDYALLPFTMNGTYDLENDAARPGSIAADVQILRNAAGEIAHFLVHLTDKNPTWRNRLVLVSEGIETGGAWVPLVTAIVLPMMQNHGIDVVAIMMRTMGMGGAPDGSTEDAAA